MKREILFRGKRKDNNEWVEGCLIIENPPLQCLAFESDEKDKYLIGKSGFADWNMSRPFTAAEVFSESIGEYIGLKDKNGKKFYQGDIYKTWYSRDTTGTDIVEVIEVVEWNNNTAGEVGYEILFFHNAEIIGKIYENPELLNK